MSTNTFLKAVVDGSDFEVDAFEGTEGAFYRAQALVGGDQFVGGQLLVGEFGTDDIESVEFCFTADVVLVACPGDGVGGDGDSEVFADFVV